MKLTDAYLAADYTKKLKELDTKLGRLTEMLNNYQIFNGGELIFQTTKNMNYRLSIEHRDVMYELISAAIKEYKDRRDEIIEKISEL